jgi:hypothetical protein
MKRPTSPTILRAACLLALAALGLMLWSLFDPRPLPVIAAMSIGQVFGTLSLLSLLYVLVLDLRGRGPSTPHS